jgi:outer membrane lipoprotein-sorting protein
MQIRQLKFGELIILLALVLMSAGCFKQQITPPDAATEGILAAISNTIAENQTLSAIAQIDIVSPQGNYPLRAVVIAKKPEYLRLELMPVIGTPDLILAANPHELKVFLPSKGELYNGKPTDINLAHFLPWKSGINEIVMILLGNYPSLSGDTVAYRSFPEEKAMQIEMKSSTGSSQVITVNKDNHLIKVVRYDESGRELYTARYEDYSGGIPIAGKISISMADGATTITVKYSDLKIEAISDLSTFDILLPAGYKAIIMD